MGLRTKACVAAGAAWGAAAVAGGLVGADPVERCLPGRATTTAPMVAACFAPGTDPEYMERFMAWVIANSDPGGPRYILGGRWSQTFTNATTGSVGDPITLTYSFPSDGLMGIGGGEPASQTNVLNARMAQWFGSQLAGRGLVGQVMARWSEISGVRYVEAGDDDGAWGAAGSPARGDVRIVSINIDGPGGVLAFNFFPNNGDMVIDSADNFGSPGNNFRFFRNTVSHEAGHGWGAAHVCPQNGQKLMEPGLNTNFDGPQLDEQRGVNANYGDLLENNDTAGTAAFLPSSAPINIPFLSINAAGDEDWYRLSLPTAGTLSVTVTVENRSPYLAGPQGASCPPTNPTVVPNAADVALEVRRDGGATVMAMSNSGGFGTGESIQGLAIPSGGNYFIRVWAVSSTGESQMYSMSATYTASGCPGDANGDNVVNFADLNLVLGNFGQSGPSVVGDVNGDGVVNFADLNMVLSFFGTVC